MFTQATYWYGVCVVSHFQKSQVNPPCHSIHLLIITNAFSFEMHRAKTGWYCNTEESGNEMEPFQLTNIQKSNLLLGCLNGWPQRSEIGIIDIGWMNGSILSTFSMVNSMQKGWWLCWELGLLLLVPRYEFLPKNLASTRLWNGLNKLHHPHLFVWCDLWKYPKIICYKLIHW